MMSLLFGGHEVSLLFKRVDIRAEADGVVMFMNLVLRMPNFQAGCFIKEACLIRLMVFEGIRFD